MPGSPGAGFLPGAGFPPGAGFHMACVRTKGGLTLHILTSSKQPEWLHPHNEPSRDFSLGCGGLPQDVAFL